MQSHPFHMGKETLSTAQMPGVLEAPVSETASKYPNLLLVTLRCHLFPPSPPSQSMLGASRLRCSEWTGATHRVSFPYDQLSHWSSLPRLANKPQPSSLVAGLPPSHYHFLHPVPSTWSLSSLFPAMLAHLLGNRGVYGTCFVLRVTRGQSPKAKVPIWKAKT